uniref:DUF7596 domain-containing protein n=1 Tax=Trichuris muris TaxID=70415 RepID=A0A5S6Q689_TRIMR
MLIAKTGYAHTVGEELLIPVKIPLSNNTVQRRIDEMANNVEDALCSSLRTTQFSLQIDESCLPGNEVLLLSYVRFIKDEKLVQELLFAKELVTDTKSNDICTTFLLVFAAEVAYETGRVNSKTRRDRTTMPGLLPAQHSDPRHQITFKWPQVDSFVKRTISPTSPFIKQMSVTVLAHDEKSRTVVATDSIGSKLYGAAAMTVINDSNGYLCFCECDQEMTDCNVVITVDNNDENCLQIRSKAIAKERCLEAHMFDVLIRKAFGLFDFDHLRNVTYDIPGDSRRIPLFRDQLGFILTDSRQFILLDINIKALDELFSQSYQFRNGESNQHIRVFDLNDPVATALGEFDQEVVGENRFDQLNAVYGKLILNASSRCNKKAMLNW